jgi:hypothetical protein
VLYTFRRIYRVSNLFICDSYDSDEMVESENTAESDHVGRCDPVHLHLIRKNSSCTPAMGPLGLVKKWNTS